MAKRLGAEVQARLVEFLGSIEATTDSSLEDHQLLEGLDDSVEIDAGRIVLFSATAVIPEFLLLTGDKRCIRAVATSPKGMAIPRRIQSPVAFFEQVIPPIIGAAGFNLVRAIIVRGSSELTGIADPGRHYGLFQLNEMDVFRATTGDGDRLVSS